MTPGGLSAPDPFEGKTPPPGPLTVHVLGAGGPAGVNFIHCLKHGVLKDRPIRVVAYDDQPHHLGLVAEADEYGSPGQMDLEVQSLGGGRHLIVAQPDALVAKLAKRGPWYPEDMVALPGPNTIALAQDKASTALVWHERQGRRFSVVPCSESAVEARRTALEEVGYPMWLRARTGAGARLASLAEHRGQADLWCRYVGMRFGESDLLAETYLPGRDYGVTLVYWHGQLVGQMARERLEYLYPQHAVSGRTGTPTVARLICDRGILWRAQMAVDQLCSAAGEAPHGVFCVDLREDKEGIAQPTEINAGRFFTTSHVGLLPWGQGVDLVGLYVGLAFGLREPPNNPLGLLPQDDGTLVLRHIDAGTHWIRPQDMTEEMSEWLKTLPTP